MAELDLTTLEGTCKALQLTLNDEAEGVKRFWKLSSHSLFERSEQAMMSVFRQDNQKHNEGIRRIMKRLGCETLKLE